MYKDELPSPNSPFCRPCTPHDFDLSRELCKLVFVDYQGDDPLTLECERRAILS